MKDNQCMWCGKYDSYEKMDSYIPFGCSNPESPEPYDPTVLCHVCSEKLYQQFKEGFQSGRRNGHWQKSNAELTAAKELNLTWIHSSGIGVDGKRILYQWVENDLINHTQQP